jgi:hypothetical protein
MILVICLLQLEEKIGRFHQRLRRHQQFISPKNARMLSIVKTSEARVFIKLSSTFLTRDEAFVTIPNVWY